MGCRQAVLGKGSADGKHSQHQMKSVVVAQCNTFILSEHQALIYSVKILLNYCFTVALEH